MKILAKPIDKVCWTDKIGIIKPARFRITDENQGEIVIEIDRVISKDLEKLNGNKMYVYKCLSCINGAVKLVEFKYELKTFKWMLWKT